MKKYKYKKIAFIVIIIIVITGASVLVYLFFNQNKPMSDLPKNNQFQNELQGKDDGLQNGDIIVKAGYLAKVDEKSIGFVSSIKNKNGVVQEKEENIEMFNLNLADPVTVITQGDLSRKRVDFSELKIGQEVFIEYDKNNKNLISINIKQASGAIETETVIGKITLNGFNAVKVAIEKGGEIFLSIPQTGVSFVKQVAKKDGSFMEEKIGLLEVPANKNVEINYNIKTNEVVSILVK